MLSDDEDFDAVLAMWEKPVEYKDPALFDAKAEEEKANRLLLPVLNEQRVRRGKKPLPYFMTCKPDGTRVTSEERTAFLAQYEGSSDGEWDETHDQSAGGAAEGDLPRTMTLHEAMQAGGIMTSLLPTKCATRSKRGTSSWEVSVDWPADAGVTDEKPLVGKLVQMECSPDRIAAWARKRVGWRLVKKLSQAWEKIAQDKGTRTRGLKLAVVAHLSEVIATTVPGGGPGDRLALTDTAVEAIQGRICEGAEHVETIRLPIALLAGVALVRSQDNNELAEDAERFRQSLLRKREDLLQTYRKRDYDFVAYLARIITGFEECTLRTLGKSVKVTVEVAEESDPAAGALTRLAQRLLAVNRVAGYDRLEVHGGLLVESWTEGARVLALTQTPEEGITIWMTPPSESPEQLASYMLSSCRTSWAGWMPGQRGGAPRGGSAQGAGGVRAAREAQHRGAPETCGLVDRGGHQPRVRRSEEQAERHSCCTTEFVNGCCICRDESRSMISLCN
jgi:hypothetical protein